MTITHISDNLDARPDSAIRSGLCDEIARLREVNAELLAAAKAALVYDDAIQSCANDPQKMSSFCSAEGDDLDALYAAWIDASRAAIAKAQP